MGATTDKIKGAASSAAGKAKKAVAKKTDDSKLAVKGTTQDAKGKSQTAKGKVKAAAKA